jgi:hypothetical protein
VVKKVALPGNAGLLRGDLFEIGHDFFHLFFPRAGYEGMQMVRHEQQKMHVPATRPLAERHGIKQHGRHRLVAKLIQPSRLATDRHEEN